SPAPPARPHARDARVPRRARARERRPAALPRPAPGEHLAGRGRDRLALLPTRSGARAPLAGFHLKAKTTMRFDIRYLTSFAYPEAVRSSHNVLRACPITDARQELLSYRVSTTPASRVFNYIDY